MSVRASAKAAAVTCRGCGSGSGAWVLSRTRGGWRGGGGIAVGLVLGLVGLLAVVVLSWLVREAGMKADGGRWSRGGGMRAGLFTDFRVRLVVG
jgi:hypothetical protein